MAVTYEWVIEYIGSDGDIQEVNHEATYAKAVEWAANAPDGETARIGLVRDVGNDLDGLTDRSWAYIDDDGEIAERFEYTEGAQDGYRVPAKYIAQMRRAT